MTNEVNIPLLRKAVEWVEQQAAIPEIDREWNQCDWVSSDIRRARGIVWNDELIFDATVTNRDAVVEALAPHCGTAYCVAGYVGQLEDPRYQSTDVVGDVHVSAVAEKALGLSGEQSYRLFAAHNSATDVRRIAEDIAGERL